MNTVDTYDLANAISDLRLHMEAAHALYLLIEGAYFEPMAERFVEGLTVEKWKMVQHNFYNFTDLMDKIMKECKAVESLADTLHEQTKQ